MGRVTRFLQRMKATHDSPTTEDSQKDLEDKGDPKLARVIDAWPELPKHIKAAILALVDIGKADRTANGRWR